MNNPNVPRFAKTAALVRDYEPTMNAVDYGFKMLKNISVNDEPEWSIIIDAKKQDVYFKTRLNPQIKFFSMASVDFSNASSVQILDIDTPEGGNVTDRFKPYSNEAMKSFLELKVIPLFPEKFFTAGGLTSKEFAERFSTHADKAELRKNQFVTGVWKTKPATKEDDLEFEIKLTANKSAVTGFISFTKGEPGYPIDHIVLIGNKLTFSYKNKRGYLLDVTSTINGDELYSHIQATESDAGYHKLYKVKQ